MKMYTIGKWRLNYPSNGYSVRIEQFGNLGEKGWPPLFSERWHAEKWLKLQQLEPTNEFLESVIVELEIGEPL